MPKKIVPKGGLLGRAARGLQGRRSRLEAAEAASLGGRAKVTPNPRMPKTAARTNVRSAGGNRVASRAPGQASSMRKAARKRMA